MALSLEAEPEAEPRTEELRRWLHSEAWDSDLSAERDLASLLQALPKAPLSPGFSGRVLHAAGFDRSLQPMWTRWTATSAIFTLILSCGCGVLVLASALGLEPAGGPAGVASAVAGMLADLGRGLARGPGLVFALPTTMAALWVDLRSATAWAYSPELMVFGAAGLGMASVALLGLSRLLAAEWPKGWDRSS